MTDPTPSRRLYVVLWDPLALRVSDAPRAACPFAEVELQAKEAKRAGVSWFDKDSKLPNDHEMLFLAFLLVTRSTNDAKLKQWALDVVRREPSFNQRGTAALPEEFTKGKVPAAFDPLVTAYGTAWKGPELDAIGKAMALGRCTCATEGR